MTDTNNEKLLSIIIPVYNNEKYFIESVLDTDKGLDKIEMILVG